MEKEIDIKDIKFYPMDIKYIDKRVEWINNPEVNKYLNFKLPVNYESTKSWYNRIVNDKKRVDFIVCIRKDDLSSEPVGFCGLLKIDVKNKHAESYMTIGETKYWGTGVSKHVRKKLLDYAFKNLKLNKIYSLINEENYKMISINKKYGFKEDGILRSEIHKDNKFLNVVILSILKDEYLTRDE